MRPNNIRHTLLGEDGMYRMSLGLEFDDMSVTVDLDKAQYDQLKYVLNNNDD